MAAFAAMAACMPRPTPQTARQDPPPQDEPEGAPSPEPVGRGYAAPGIVLALLLSVPVWAGIGVAIWYFATP